MRICMVIVATAMVGCGSSTSPAFPTPATASPTPATRSTPLSTLAISAFHVRLLEVSNGRYVYRPTLVLSETSLKDAATLTDIVLSGPDGDSFSIIVKGGTPMRVLAGQTWDLTLSPYYPAFIDIDTRSEIADVRATRSIRATVWVCTIGNEHGDRDEITPISAIIRRADVVQLGGLGCTLISSNGGGRDPADSVNLELTLRMRADRLPPSPCVELSHDHPPERSCDGWRFGRLA